MRNRCWNFSSKRLPKMRVDVSARNVDIPASIIDLRREAINNLVSSVKSGVASNISFSALYVSSVGRLFERGWRAAAAEGGTVGHTHP